MEEIKNNLSIVVDDGYERVEIKNKFGNVVGEFYFNPTDMGIIKRFNDISKKFNTVVEPLKDISINADGTAEGEFDTAKLEEAENRLYELCDYLFGGNMSKAFFGKIAPFSPVNGHFYCENALNGVAGYVSNRFDEEVKKINSRVEKYTHGVRTGKHSGGRQ